jgi:hypothetical protein
MKKFRTLKLVSRVILVTNNHIYLPKQETMHTIFWKGRQSLGYATFSVSVFMMQLSKATYEYGRNLPESICHREEQDAYAKISNMIQRSCSRWLYAALPYPQEESESVQAFGYKQRTPGESTIGCRSLSPRRCIRTIRTLIT